MRIYRYKSFPVLIAILFSGITVKAQWVLTGFPPDKIVAGICSTGDYLFASYDDSNAFFRSPDNGDSWLMIERPGEHGYDRIPGVEHILALTIDRGLVLAASEGHYTDSTISTILFGAWENGGNWSIWGSNPDIIRFFHSNGTIYGAMKKGGLVQNHISQDYYYYWTKIDSGLNGEVLNIAGVGNNIFAATTSGGIYRYDNADSVWKNIGTFTKHDAYDIASSGNDIFVADGRLWRSSDSGGFWKYLSINNIPYIRDIKTLAISGNYIFAGGTGNPAPVALFSTDRGETWTDFTDRLVNSGELKFFSIIGNFIFAATNDGLWRHEIPGLNSVAKVQSLDQINLSLSPNPTSGSGNISYTLAKPSQVKIEMYNAIGQFMQPVTDEFESEGGHVKNFDLTHFPSGGYFFRFQSEGISQVKSILLIK